MSSGGAAHKPGHIGQKRLKIDIACQICRAKKIKCDGTRPGTHPSRIIPNRKAAKLLTPPMQRAAIVRRRSDYETVVRTTVLYLAKKHLHNSQRIILPRLWAWSKQTDRNLEVSTMSVYLEPSPEKLKLPSMPGLGFLLARSRFRLQ